MFFEKRFKGTLLTSVSVGAVLIGTNAFANPDGANVVTGDVAINGLGTDHVIIQNDSNRSVVNWDQFSIGVGETTTINQITDNSSILNRVVTDNVSEIYGTLESNGQVFLINQSGIVIGESGIVDTNGLVASTLDVSNTDFLGAGEMIFSQGIEKAGGIEIHGKIRSVSGGDIFLLSREVTIGASAEISSKGGYVGLGAGEEILLKPTDTGDGRISIRAGKGKIVNQGLIAGAVAELKAAGGNEYALAINNTGVVRATGYSKKGGKIRLGGGGKVRNTGKLVARKKVIVRSKKKIINNGQIKAGDGNKGGEIIFEAPEIEVKTDSILDVAGALGGGRIFVGGGFQGSGADHDGNAVDITDNAIKVTVDSGAVLTASATQSGDAGEIVVWADGHTNFAGSVTANAVDGDGGFIELSGKEHLTYSGEVSASSQNGAAGMVLFDPGTVNITNSTGLVGTDTFSDAHLQTTLNTGTSVMILTSGAGTTNGTAEDIIIGAGVSVVWSGDATLTLTAGNDIKAEDNVLIQHANSTNDNGGVVFNAGNDIIIGKATGRTANGGVAIGSVHGKNTFTAGNNIHIIGGDQLNAHAHLGYRQDTNDVGAFGKGDILLEADGEIMLQGGDEFGTFAQVGHGGFTLNQSVGAIAGNITVHADKDDDGMGNLILTHAEKDSGETESSSGSHAQIGHGSLILQKTGDDVGLSQSTIQGNITVKVGGDDEDTNRAELKINTEFVSSDDDSDVLDQWLSQIGHGGRTLYSGTTVDGNEATHGAISGDITLNIDGKLTEGGSAAPGDTDDQYVIQSKIGHGGHASMAFVNNLFLDNDDNSFDAFHGDISGAINVTASEINLLAKDAALNSAKGDGTLVDNSQQSQIGHGSTTVFERSVGAQFGASGGEIPTGTPVTGTDTRFDGKNTTPVPANDGKSTLDVEVEVAEADLANLQADFDTKSGELQALQAEKDALELMKTQLEARKAELDAKVTDMSITMDEQTELDIINGAGAGSITAKTGEITDKEGMITTKQGEVDAIYKGVDASGDPLDPPTGTLADLNKEFADLKEFLDGVRTEVVPAGPADANAGLSVDVARNVTITDNRISGDITITDDTEDDTAGITLETDIAVGLNAITKDVMIARIGHASVVGVDSLHGSQGKTETTTMTDPGGGSTTSITGIDAGGVDAFNGGNVTIRQAHILGADITVDTATHGGEKDDITLKTNIAAGLGAAEDNTTVSQIGHSADVFVSTGNGGASTRDDVNSGDGGDITLVRGTVWDGALEHDPIGGDQDNLNITNTTDIYIKSANEVIIDSDTASALAAAERNNAESSIGHGFKQRLVTGDGGTSTGNGAAGGAGGDILVYQGLDVREYGVNNDRFDDYAYGLRGDIYISASNATGNAINMTSDDSSALSKTDFNTDLSTIGHGDVLETASGKGGDGSSGLDFEGDSNDPTATDISELDQKGQVAVYGGRGGHIDVQLGRHTGIDQYGSTGGGGMFFDTRQKFASENQADLGDTRAITLSGVAAPKRQGLSLIEGDIFVNVLGGTVNVAGSINNALAPSQHAVSESIIGHNQHFTADAGDGGKAGDGNFHTQPETVFQTELTAEQYLNYASGIGSNRGGNGGDVRLTHGDITDRVIQQRIGDYRAEITHDTDADHSGSANVTFDATTGYSQPKLELVDGSSDIYMYLHDEDAANTAQSNADSLIVKSTINAGLSEKNGSIYSTVGHHVRLIGEGGKGGAGGSSNTEFDQDGNSLFIDETGQEDVAPLTEAVDETAIQAGAVYIQPNSSGGRGGDALILNDNISGDIVINAARRVTVQSGDGHGGNTIINATLGHTTDLFSATQAGGAAGDLYEQDHANAEYDGGIINVGGAQITGGDHSANSVGDKTPSFDHILIDGNRDDQFNLENNGESQSIASEDGIAITQGDRDARVGSTFNSIHNDPALGSNPIGNTNAVIFHDEEADPQYIKNDVGGFVLNNETNNGLYAENTENLGRYGRVVATYDGTQTQNSNEFFQVVSGASGGAPGFNGKIPIEVFVDMDQDGDVDLVDFDRDGRLDIVDVDRDGKMDIIDGRANYVSSTTVNQISGLGVLDYVAVTGKNFNETTASSTGEAWTNHNELKSDDLLADYNNNNNLLTDTNSGTDSDFVAYVSDFSTANGGRGGDAYSQVGYSSGDISVSTGNNDKGEADSLIVKTTAPDGVPGNGSEDFIRAIIGHNAVQISDAGGEYAAYRVGREGLNMESSEHASADGGAAGHFAINGNGGRGGNATLIQGIARDHYAGIDTGQSDLTEMDHLVGDIFINTPNDLDNSISNDAGRISITGDIGALSPKDHNLVSQIGHHSLSGAAGGNGGVGASKGSKTGVNSGSQTELADGGDGGQAYLTQHYVKGDITVMTASDDVEPGSNDFSIVMSATDAHPLAGENQIIAQIGHGRQAKVGGGDGGDGNDGQFRGNGGAGGNATLNQNEILDSVITVDLVDVTRGYDGNGMKMLSESISGSNDIYRVQVGHGDLGEAEAGNGGDGTPEFEVLEQINQTANGGIGGDAIINQAGYNHDIIMDIGSNEKGAEALQILSSAAAVTNGKEDHLLATVGHGGMANSVGGKGGNGGLNGAITGIPTEADLNLIDGDYFLRSNNTNAAVDVISQDGDSVGVIDSGNRIVLGTTRRGGDGGDGVINQNLGGTGRTITDREGAENDYGVNDTNGADITITVYDQYDDTLTPDDFNGVGERTVALTADNFKSGFDGVLIQTKIGPGTNQTSSLFVNSALVGHHNFSESTGGDGGNGIASSLGATISDGDGGDGGTGTANIYEVRGNITIDNNKGIEGYDETGGDSTSTADLDNSTTAKEDTNIKIETINGSASDVDDHRGDARVGHMSQAEANGGKGGESAREAGSPPSFPATISTQGGDGGDALTFQGQQEGDITLTAENSVIVSARDTTVGAGTLVAGVGHRVFAEATAGDGNYGGTYIADPAGTTGKVAATVTVTSVTKDVDGNVTATTPTVYTLMTDGTDTFACDGTNCYPLTGTNDFDANGNPTAGPQGLADLTTIERDASVTNPYFTYEALREFHHRRTSGATDAAAFAALSEFEQKLVAPVTDYFENKEGELEIFLDRLVGDSLELIQHNERDDDFIGNTDFTIPALSDAGDDHIKGAGDGELQTLTAILAASGHGGNASVTQGSVGLSGPTDELAASGNILITAKAFDTADAARGIIVEGVAGAVGGSFQMGHVGHQSEAHQVAAGNGKDVNGRNANANGIAGDGGDAVVDQYALNGGVDLVSDHEILISAKDASPAAHETRAWVGHRLTIGSDYTKLRPADSVTSGNGGDEESVPFADGHNGNGGDVFIYQRGVISGTARAGATNSTYDTEISLAALQDSDKDISITIEAVAPGPSAPDVETHIGHDFLIHAVKAGDGGRQAVLSGPEGASEGLLEGNGGDIFIAQTDLGADIDIVGRDAVAVNASSSLSNHAHLMIGHERTVGNSAELADALDGSIADNPRSGTIVAGFGGDAHIEDVNGTAMASRVAAKAGIIEDGDSGRIEIALGKITGSDDDNSRFITITSITEDVDVTSVAATGSKSILEIGNQQQVIAGTQSAGELQSVPFVQTAGDAGGIFINRATIDGDILIQAIDAERGTEANMDASDGDARKGDGRQVVIDSTSGAGSTAITQIGHETQFTANTSVPVTARAAFGEDRNFLFETNLTNYVALKPAGTGEENEATLRDAQNAVEDMRDVVRALELAHENIDRFPAADNIDDGTSADADQGELIALLKNANDALDAAEFDLDSIGHGDMIPKEASAVNAILGTNGHAKELIDAASDYYAILKANIVPNAGDQIADFAEGGDIVYGALPSNATSGSNPLNSHTDSITGVAGIAHTSVLTIQHAPALTAEGFTVADTGIVEGNVDILSGRDSDLTLDADGKRSIDLKSVAAVIGNDDILANNFGGDGFTVADDIDDSVVQITATADSRSLTEIGHRRIMKNETSFAGGDTNASPEEGGKAGDAGSIVVSNTTRGDINVQAEEVVIKTAGAAGDAELHLLHSSHTTNTAGWSDIQTKLGNGGDIYNTTVVSGGVAINAEQIASAVDAKDRKILATGAANTFIHMGHQAEDKNESKSDPNEAGGKGDAQTNLGSNRGGKVVSLQSVTGNSADDLVIITLDAAGDGNATDLIIETGGDGGSDIRLGSGEDGTMKGIYQDGTSGVNQSDDGGEITLTQVVGGDIEINTVEDLHINVLGKGGTSVYVGHDAEQFGESGQTNAPAGTINQYGERVTVTQTVTGNVNIATTRSYTATLGADAGELHVGHEGTQSAFSADDSANPSDFEAGNTASAAGVNDSFTQPDVMATQVIDAAISIVTGEITLENLGTANQIHFGHEATHKAAVDGDLKDAAENSTGHVVASSKINASDLDILFEAKGVTGTELDGVVTAKNGVEGDIQLVASDVGEIQVGHSSTSTMGDVTTGSLVKEGQFNAEQIIGNATLDENGNEVANTGDSVIEFRAAQDIIVASVDGETQVGHFIVERGNDANDKDPLFTDGDAATGVNDGDSELRQIVGSDIIFGDKTKQRSGGVGESGAGNNVVIETGASGRTIIGHQSPESNEWQVEGTRSVTVQLLDGDITIEAGTDEGVDAPDGKVIASAAAALKDESGEGDDLLIKSGGGVARVGHNMATYTADKDNETQRSAGDIWVRAGGDVHILGGAVGHEDYHFDALTVSKENSTPGSTIRDRIRGNTTIAAGQNSATEDSTTTLADILKIDGTDAAVEINSGYGGKSDKDVDGELRFFLPAQEGLSVVLGKGVTFNDSASNSDAVPARSSSSENVFENEGGKNHEHPFELASEMALYTDEFINDGNFTFYFEATAATMPEYTPFLSRGTNDSGFNVTYLDDDGTSAGGAMNTDGLSEDFIGTSSYKTSCDEQSGGDSSGECSEVRDRFNGVQPGYGSNTEWSGQSGGNANTIIPYLDNDDELIDNTQVVGFTVYNEPTIEADYQEPVITTKTVSVEHISGSNFNVKTVIRKLPKYDGRIITRNSPSGTNQMSGFVRTVTNPQPLGQPNSPITTSTEGGGVNSFDVSSNAVFSTMHQFFTGYDAGNDYQVTAVDNRIGTYVDDTGIDAYMSQYAGAMSSASSYQMFEEKIVE